LNDESLRHLIQEGETEWTLRRNAASIGMYCIDAYLKWRAEQGE
jgi:hypothetical protein